MSNKQVLALWDFDKTLTTKDSTLFFLFYTQSWSKIFVGGIRLGPTLLGMKLGLVSSTKAKEKVYDYFFGGWEIEKFKLLCEGFANDVIPKLINQKAYEKLNWHREQGHCVCVVSASPQNYLEPWCSNEEIKCIGTTLRFNRDKIGVGIISDCTGIEKVVRIKKVFNLPEFETVYAYGNSKSGDGAMLEIADKAFFKSFG